MNTTKSNFFKIFSLLSTTILGSFIIGNLQPIKQAEAKGIRGTYSFNAYNFQNRYIRHRNFQGYIEVPNDTLGKKDATFRVRDGLANSNCTSFESVNFPGHFLRHQNWRIKLSENDGSELFRNDATFCQRPGVVGQGMSFESFNYPSRYIRHKNFELWLEKSDGSDLFLKDATFIPQGGLY